MPLNKAKTKEAVHQNIRKMMHEGKRPQKQIIAIALQQAGMSKKKAGSNAKK